MIASGDWWRIEDDGTLYIYCVGDMPDYYSWARSPWYYSRELIKAVSISNSVTSIGDSAFYDCANLTSVVIPDNVTSIGEYAFSDCYNLASVTIGNGVTSIDSSVFLFCYRLTSVTIGSGVTSIDDRAFNDCYGLTSFLVHSDNQAYTAKAGALFNKTQTTLIRFPLGKTGAYEIPASVTSIGDYAFFYCRSLTSVTIGDGVTSIGDYAFYRCDSLTSAIIGNGVTSISEYAFARCDNLASVTIGNGVTSIGDHAFVSCGDLESLTLADSVTIIGGYAFDGVGGGAIDNIYYTGTEAQWNAIIIGECNEAITEGIVHYNYVPPAPVAPGAFSVAVRYVDADGNEFTTSFPLNMVSEYYAITPPIKITYSVGETLDYTGLVVARRSSDGTSADITSNCTFVPAAGTPVTQTATVSVRYDGAEIGNFLVTAIALEADDDPT